MEEHSQNGQQENGSLAQVRELLFGAQVRDFDSRYQTLQNEIRESLQQLKDSVLQRIDGVENSLREELSALERKHDEGSAGLSDAMQAISHKFGSDLALRAQEISARLDTAEESMRKYTLNHTQNVWDDMKSHHDTLSHRIDQELGQIRHTTTTRSSLGEMFQELALRLGNEEDAPKTSESANY